MRRRIDVMALGLVAGLLILLVPFTLRGDVADTVLDKKEKARRVQCANQLRGLTQAGMMYADKPSVRWWPHYSPRRELDGDVDTNHTPKSVRALLWFDMVDNPEQWVCPSSLDGFVKIEDTDTQESMRLWFWGGQHGKDPKVKGQTPWLYGDDPKLSETWELSYGWTRRTMKSASRSTILVNADRAATFQGGEQHTLGGNHHDGWNVSKADSTVEWIAKDYDPGGGATMDTALGWLTHTGKGGGYLAIRPKDYKASEQSKPAWAKKTRPGGGDEKTDADADADADAGGCGQSCRLATPNTFRGAGQGLALLLLVLGLVVLRRREP